MDINLSLNPGTVNRAVVHSPAVARVVAAQPQSVFKATEAMNDALRELPESRKDMVERGMRLIGQVTYPPRETIQKIANLLAMSATEQA